MGGLSIWHWLVVLLIVLVLFGRGRVADIMGDFGKGIKSFKQGLGEEERATAPPPAKIAAPEVAPTAPASETTTTGNP